MQIQDIVSLPIKDLVYLKNEIEAMFVDVKQQKELLEEAIDLRFMERTKELLANTGQATGTVYFTDDVYTISAVVAKKITWNQDKLAELVNRLTEEEKNRYLDITYKIHEQKYLAHFPLELRYIFDSAREVTTGKAKFNFKELV